MEAGQPRGAGGADVLAADIGDAPVAEREQMRGRLAQSHLVVDAEADRVERRHVAQQLRVRQRAQQVEAVAARRGGGYGDDPRDPRGGQFLDMAEFDFAVVVVNRQDQPVALRVAALRQRLGNGGVEVVGHIRQQQADQLARPAAHDARRRVTHVAQLLGHLAHFRLGFGTDARIVRHRPADCGNRDSQLLRHLFRRDH
ncbi:hypothetical protein D9M73_174580 [compost metagenome]